MSTAQLLIIEDLGIPKSAFEKLAQKKGLKHEIVWHKEKANTDLVEILVNVKQPIGAEMMEKYPNLKMIAVAFTGFDSVNMTVAKEKQIAVYNVPSYSTKSVTELAVGLSISLLRRIPEVEKDLHSENWNVAPGLELSGRTVGIMGTGEIGLQTAKVFNALGCKLLGWSRTERKELRFGR